MPPPPQGQGWASACAAGELTSAVSSTAGAGRPKSAHVRDRLGAIGAGEQAAVPDAMKALGQYVDEEPADELAEIEGHCRVVADACLIFRQDIGGRRVIVERADLVLGDPDLDQVTAESVPAGKPVRELAGKVFLDNLTLEFDRAGSMLCHGLSPRKPGPDIRFSEPNLSTPRGALQS